MDVMTKVPVREQDPKVRAKNFQEVCLGYNLEEAQQEASRCINCKNAQCVKGCPVCINIPGFIQEVKEGSHVFIALDDKFAGHIIISDELKADAGACITALKKLNMKTVMLTGDHKKTADIVAEKLSIDEVYSELLPQDKVELAERLISQERDGGKLVFMGDGINDAPVLARADIGVAMGGAGSDAAIEAADIVLMTDEPLKLITACNISRKTLRIVKENIIFAIGVKVITLILAALGAATMWAAVFADVGVAFIAIINALRASSVKEINMTAH